MSYISNILYWISTGLLVPVVLMLILFFLRSLLLIGNFFGQYVAMHKTYKEISQILASVDTSNVLELSTQLPIKSSIPMINAAKAIIIHADSDARIELELAKYEDVAESEISSAKTLGKMAPMFGLMGTLIPMGPALVGLSAGDMTSMAYNMQVAFATTVVGLFSAAIGVVILQVKRRWFKRDMANLQFIADLIAERKNMEGLQ